MFVSGFNIEVSFQSTVEEHYFDIKERDFVVREGTGKLDGRMQVVYLDYLFQSTCNHNEWIKDLHCISSLWQNGMWVTALNSRCGPAAVFLASTNPACLTVP